MKPGAKNLSSRPNKTLSLKPVKTRKTNKPKYAQDNILVDSMLEIEELFKLSMTDDNDLGIYLKEHPEDKKFLERVSKNLMSYLDAHLIPSLSQLKEYMVALQEMKRSHGYSMLKFFQEHRTVANYLYQEISGLKYVYFNYVAFCQKKMQGQLNLEDEPSAEELEFSDEEFDIPKLLEITNTFQATRDLNKNSIQPNTGNSINENACRPK